MIELFVDTTSNCITIALNKNNVIDCRQQTSNMKHSYYVMNMIDNILKDNNIKVEDLTKIIVCNGPGSFTGIRVGVSICKTIAYVKKIPITTISSLELISLGRNGIVMQMDKEDNFYYGVYKDGNIIIEAYDKKDRILSLKDKYGVGYIKDPLKVDESLFLYCKNKSTLNPHSINPLYLKLTSAEIGLLND